MTDREKLIRNVFCFDSPRDCEAARDLIAIVDSLRSENAAKDEEIARLNANKTLLIGGFNKMQRERECGHVANQSATSPVSAEARFTDRERLDWLDKHIANGSKNTIFTPDGEGSVREAIDAAMLSAGLKPSVPAETPKVSIESLGEVFMDTAGSIYGSDEDLDNGIRACFRLAGCEDRIEEEK